MRKAVKETDARLAEAVEEWKTLTEIRYELATTVYEAQDEQTQVTMQMLVNRLRLSSAGYVEIQVNPPRGSLVPVKIEQQYLDYNLLYIVTQIFSDLAVTGVRVGTFKPVPGVCASCGAEIKKARK